MAVRQDYRPRPPVTTPRRTRLRWTGFGVIAMALVALIVVLVNHYRSQRQATLEQAALQQAAVPTQAPTPTPARTATRPTPAPTQAPVRSRFEFYSLLAERQVQITPEEITQRNERGGGMAPPSLTPTPQPTGARLSPTPLPAGNDAKMLQVGAYRTSTEADRMRATLAMMGITARVEPAAQSDGTSLHRVRIGPFRDQQQVQAMRQRLQQNNIEVLIVPAR